MGATSRSRSSRPRSVLVKILAVLAVAAIIFRLAIFPSQTNAAWFDDSYAYRQKTTIGNTGSADSNKKVKLDVDTASLISAGKMKSTCADTRFTDASGKVLQYYIDSSGGACNTNSTDYYVLLPTINGSTPTYIYMYYGNPSATAATVSTQFGVATFSPTSGPTFASEEQGRTPVVYWKFDEGTGTTADDSSKYVNNGTITAPTWAEEAQCISGKCLKFDGSSTTITKTYSADAELDPGSGGFTVSVWFRHPATAVSSEEDLIDRRHAVTRGVYAGYNILLDASGHLCAGIQQETGELDSICSTTSYTDNVWHNMEFVKTSNTAITLYIDSTKVAENTSLTVTGSISSSPSDLYVGQNGMAQSYFWNGYMDELKIYGYAKSTAQVKSDYVSRSAANAGSALGASTSSSLSNGLIGYWKLDETSWTNDCSTGSVLDSSGNGNNGDACPASTGPTGGAQGRFGRSGSFDGTDDYVTVPNFSAKIVNSAAMTIAGWVYTPNNPAGHSAYFGMRNYSNADFYIVQLSGSNNLECRFTNSSGTSYTASQSVTGGAWQHVALVYDGSRITCFVNGIAGASVTASGTITDTASPFNIGDNAANNYLNGRVDDVRFYTRALSSSEVRSLYDWAPGPVGAWNLDEHSGTTAHDSSGNGHDGTLTNGPVWTNGKVGGALSFDNNDDYVTMGDNLDMSANDNLTLTAWAYRNDTSSGDVIIAKKNGAGAGNNGYAIYCTTNTSCTAYIADGSLEFTISGTLGAANQWHHVAVVIDRSGNSASKFYSDGIDTTTSRTGTISSLGSLGTSASLRIGRYSNSTFPFNGMIDQVKVFNYPLTSKQIVSEVNSGHPAVGSPVGSAIGYWKFDEGSGTTAHNSGNCGTTCDGTLTNMASPATSTSGWTGSGKYSKGLIFDQAGGSSTTDYVSMGTTSNLAVNGPFTVSAWINPTSFSGATTSNAIVGRYDDASSKRNYLLYTDSSGQLLFQTSTSASCASGGAVTLSSGKNLSTGTWSHVVGVYDGTNMHTYLNGQEVGTPVAQSSICTTSTPFIVGARYGGGSLDSTSGFKGTIDEVKFYNYSLNADDIKTEYNQGKAQVLGALSTESDGKTASNAIARGYCVPGDTTSCSGPVAEWKLDEGTGTAASDTSGNNNQITLANGTSWATGKVGKALSFDGCSGCNQDDSASVTMTLPTVMTIEGWIYPRSTGEGSLGRFLDNGNDITVFVNGSNVNRLEFTAIWSTTNGNWYATPGLTYNAWNHVVITYDYGSTSNTPTFYINDIKQTTSIGTGSPAGTHSITSHVLYMGNNSSGSRTWDGSIDNVQIYNYARTPAQVAWDYNRGRPVGWWKFDECQGTTAYDATGNGLAGTISKGSAGSNTAIGTCTSGTTSEMWNDGTSGKFNAGLGFDGTDDTVTIADNSIFNSSAATIQAWVNFNQTSTSKGADQFVIDKVDSTSPFTSFLIRQNNSTNIAAFCFTNASRSVACADSTTALSAGVWYHLVGVYDGSHVTGYINGVQNGSQPSLSGSLLDSNGVLRISGDNNPANYTDGIIDDVRVYNYALTPTQVKLLYDNDAAVRFSPATGSP